MLMLSSCSVSLTTSKRSLRERPTSLLLLRLLEWHLENPRPNHRSNTRRKQCQELEANQLPTTSSTSRAMRNKRIMAVRKIIKAKTLLHQMTKFLAVDVKGLPLGLQEREALVDPGERSRAKMSRVMTKKISMILKMALKMSWIANGKIGATFARRLEACCAAMDVPKLRI